ncbi:cytochrome C [Algibacter pacificus]|uniref:cytochrome C n=1 Tax=Algibacter pacificus TaxID=2599389 RepID=UPI0011C9E830|nr:cytochrome C [Algibacter pacificus]
MKKIIYVVFCLSALFSCKNNTEKEVLKKTDTTFIPTMQMDDKRISLNLNDMQKNHQLANMRSHLEAVQELTVLIANEDYNEASKLAYTKLGSTTEMRLMCASFGDKNFERLGLEFHKSADKMSETLKSRDKNKSLIALSNTLAYCVQCHKTYKQ